MENGKEVDFESLIRLHQAQFLASAVPELYWKTIVEKLTETNFDASSYFSIIEDVDSPCWVKCDKPVLDSDPSGVFLIDHAWLYDAGEARDHLMSVGGLLHRMAALMNVPAVVDMVENEMWKYNRSFSVRSYSDVEKCLPLWYIMDEFGCSIQHSDNPNCRLVPFVFLPEGASYTLLFPLRSIEAGERLCCDYAEGVVDSLLRKIMLLPWFDNPLENISFDHFQPDESYFVEGRLPDTLPLVDVPNGVCPLDKPVLKVYSEYSFVNTYLKHEKFQLVQNPDEADILWLTQSFYDFEKLSSESPHKFINQFPHESVMTVKDLLALICQFEECDSCSDECSNCILPETYNMKMELPQFISYFRHREASGLDNHWICKPFNLARGLDCFITNNLNALIRISSTGPKIVQKYIETPLLFNRPNVGLVKFDIRYVVLLKQVCPLEVYVYKKFFLRFANKEYSLDELGDYQKHFTVMNYSEEAPMLNLFYENFVSEFEIQYPDLPWARVQADIFKMIKKVFTHATLKPPPMGIAESHQSRALYAMDIILQKSSSGSAIPKLLEVNWVPDCQRACEFYPSFFDDIFLLLFLDVQSEDILKL